MAPAPAIRPRSQPNDVQTQEILVTLAERPYPFPSRTRKSSSPAPKILRGQPFGKIGRRQDLVLSGALQARRVRPIRPGTRRWGATSGYAAADDCGRSGRTARRTIAPSCRLSVPHVRGRRLATRRALARPSLRGVQPRGPARTREAVAALPDREPRDLRDLPG